MAEIILSFFVSDFEKLPSSHSSRQVRSCNNNIPWENETMTKKRSKMTFHFEKSVEPITPVWGGSRFLHYNRPLLVGHLPQPSFLFFVQRRTTTSDRYISFLVCRLCLFSQKIYSRFHFSLKKKLRKLRPPHLVVVHNQEAIVFCYLTRHPAGSHSVVFFKYSCPFSPSHPLTWRKTDLAEGRGETSARRPYRWLLGKRSERRQKWMKWWSHHVPLRRTT